MPKGLQVFDENGINVLDTNSGTVKIFGKFDYDPNVVVFYSDLFATETPFFIASPSMRYEDSQVKVEFSGNKCTVTNTRSSFKRSLYVGVY
ncbi:hypothetical protein [Psychrobacter sp. 72-O-c]|uniref:hypothetical protein n=1 Tax=Psychrobacter sp. 72-O-c TaxID=2774125 RepID=UPI0019194E9C|nr:hypothetical protein [Psychrobacter sp. 72-O-c]